MGLYARLRGRTGADLTNTVRRLRAAGVNFTREDFSWTTIEPRRGDFRWASTDTWVKAAARGGLQIMATVWGSPPWISSDWAHGPSTTAEMNQYARFVRAVVHRYGSRGAFWTAHPNLPKLPIRYYDIWNEPYLPQYWTPGPDPAAYAKLFKTAVVAARPVDPDAKFLLETNPASFAPGSPVFMDAMFNAVPDLAAYADAVSVHPYASNGWSPATCANGTWRVRLYQTCRIVDVRSSLDAHGGADVGLWITEIGYSTAKGNGSAVSENTQAGYVHQFFSDLRGSWRGLVQGVQWYAYQTTPKSPDDFGGNFGLVRPDGTPKPAWSAFVSELALGP